MIERAVTIDYTNWRGERSIRHVVPISFHFEENDFHLGVQWLMRAEDLDKGRVTRMFAMANIHSWKPPDRVTLTGEK